MSILESQKLDMMTGTAYLYVFRDGCNREFISQHHGQHLMAVHQVRASCSWGYVMSRLTRHQKLQVVSHRWAP